MCVFMNVYRPAGGHMQKRIRIDIFKPQKRGRNCGKSQFYYKFKHTGESADLTCILTMNKSNYCWQKETKKNQK